MKKIFILLILAICISTACNDDDTPVLAPDYHMPLITSDMLALKSHLRTLDPDVKQTQVGNTITISCKPAASNTNMFSELVYVYTYKRFELDEFTFSYKLHSNATKSDEDKLKAFLKRAVIEL